MWQGWAGHGMAWHGRHGGAGKAGLGKARHGMAGHGQARLGEARQGRRGEAGHGGARRGTARRGKGADAYRKKRRKGNIMAKTRETTIELKPINIQKILMEIEGDSPLITHAWSAKSKKEMLDKMQKKAKTARVSRDPEKDYQEAFYRLPGGEPGFPTIGFKAAAVSAGGRFSEGMKMTEMRGSFHIEGELVEIIGEPEMREDTVRVGMGSADLRYRPEFKNWKTYLPIRYNADKISLDQLVNIFNLAGFGVGVGEWRPEKDGQYGMFHVVSIKQEKKA